MSRSEPWHKDNGHYADPYLEENQFCNAESFNDAESLCGANRFRSEPIPIPGRNRAKMPPDDGYGSPGRAESPALVSEEEDTPSRRSRLSNYINAHDVLAPNSSDLALNDEGYSDGEASDALFNVRLTAPCWPVNVITIKSKRRLAPNVTLAQFIRPELINECFSCDMSNIEIKFNKLRDIAYVLQCGCAEQSVLATFLATRFEGLSIHQGIGVLPYDRDDDVTNLLKVLFFSQRAQILSYKQIYQSLPTNYLILPHDFFPDPEEFVEVHERNFYGIRKKNRNLHTSLSEEHILCLISIRKLAPLVQNMITEQPQAFDRKFLERLHHIIMKSEATELETRRITIPSPGEGVVKPLEHLVAAVTGVEVIWVNGQKVIRKLELPQRDPRITNAAPNPNQEVAKVEAEIVKLLTDILKEPANLYLSIEELQEKYRGIGRHLNIAQDDYFRRLLQDAKFLREFIIDRPKHFQVLGERSYEAVTLSHRAQIKRICNDMQKVLRPKKPKCISNAQVAAEFSALWSSLNDRGDNDRNFNVEEYGVCYTDCLLVTIPQHWGVQCSEFVSADGTIVTRQRGQGPECIPDNVPNDRDHLYCWQPRVVQSPSQKKKTAHMIQQILNMFRKDLTAFEYIQRVPRPAEPNRYWRTAETRTDQPLDGQKKLPTNLEMEENDFVPLYHRYTGEQVNLIQMGQKDLYALFDNADAYFVAEGRTQSRVIKLTTDARKEIIERRVIDLLRIAGAQDKNCLYRKYNMYFGGDEYTVADIDEALRRSHSIVEKDRLLRAKPFFRLLEAKERYSNLNLDSVLKIFLLSCSALSYEELVAAYQSKFGRRLTEGALDILIEKGAIRQSAESKKYDLHDICRVVRNLIYVMNDCPDRPVYVNGDLSSLSSQHVLSLMAYSGDYTYLSLSEIRAIMQDFSMCFRRCGEGAYRLHDEFVCWQMTPEERELSQNRRERRGSGPNHNMNRLNARNMNHNNYGNGTRRNTRH